MNEWLNEKFCCFPTNASWQMSKNYILKRKTKKNLSHSAIPCHLSIQTKYLPRDLGANPTRGRPNFLQPPDSRLSLTLLWTKFSSHDLLFATIIYSHCVSEVCFLLKSHGSCCNSSIRTEVASIKTT